MIDTQENEDDEDDEDETPFHCIRHTHEERQNLSWCGKPLGREWAFTSVDHATYSREHGDMQLPCPECVAKVSSLLNKT